MKREELQEEKNYQDAIKKLGEGKYNDAIQLLEKQLNEFPNYFPQDILNLISQLYLEKGEIEKSIYFAKKSIDINPISNYAATALEIIAGCYKYSNRDAEHDDAKKAVIETYKKIIRESKNKDEKRRALLLLSGEFRLLGVYQKAIDSIAELYHELSNDFKEPETLIPVFNELSKIFKSLSEKPNRIKIKID